MVTDNYVDTTNKIYGFIFTIGYISGWTHLIVRVYARARVCMRAYVRGVRTCEWVFLFTFNTPF